MNTEHLHQQYNDVLSADADTASMRVVNDLHTMYATATVPAHVNDAIARAVQQRTAEQAQRPARRRSFFGSFGGWRLRTVGVVVALMLAMIAGGAYAVAPVLNQAFTQLGDKGLQQVDAAELMHDVDLQQTIDGYTIHVQRLYADANRVMVGFTVRGPGQDVLSFTPNEMYLRTVDGVDLPMDRRLGLTKEGGVQGNIYKFDADAIRGNPDTLDLRLQIHDLMVFGTDYKPTADKDEPTAVIAGPFTFDFTVPFVAGRVVDVNQTITVDETPVTLDRVIVTPSAARVFLRVQAMQGIPADEWFPEMTLSGDNWTVGPYEGVSGWTEDDGRQRWTFEHPLFDKHGEWTFKIDHLQGSDMTGVKVGDTIPQTIIEGPWEFRFVVP